MLPRGTRKTSNTECRRRATHAHGGNMMIVMLRRESAFKIGCSLSWWTLCRGIASGFALEVRALSAKTEAHPASTSITINTVPGYPQCIRLLLLLLHSSSASSPIGWILSMADDIYELSEDRCCCCRYQVRMISRCKQIFLL